MLRFNAPKLLLFWLEHQRLMFSRLLEHCGQIRSPGDWFLDGLNVRTADCDVVFAFHLLIVVTWSADRLRPSRGSTRTWRRRFRS